MQQTLTYPNRPRRGGLVAGIAVSILLHAVLLAFLRAPSGPPAMPDEHRWSQPLTIRIVPPPPPPRPPSRPITRTEPPPPRTTKPDKPAARPAPARAAPERAEPDAAAPSTMTAVPPEPAEAAPADSSPRFDPDAARAAARSMANDLNPSTNWAAEKLNKGKEWKETKEQRLGRNVENAARPDCRTAYAGAGLLAPLIMLMDKKDSGCKF